MGFSWQSQDLTRNLRTFPARLDHAVTTVVDFQAAIGEAALKTRAPWTDRTAAARNGLYTTTFHIPEQRHEITFSHSVYYGIWLEVANNQRYAVLLDTMNMIGDDTMRQLEGLFGRMA